jgi:methanethiol S-methyltransferase
MASASAPWTSRAIAWLGALLFLVSLACTAFTYVVTMAPVTAGDGARAAAVNVLLFSAFALHHSVFARERIRARVRAIVPDELERSLYVWVASLLLIAVCVLWQPVPGIAWQANGLGVWVLRAIRLAGVGITIVSARAIDVFELSGIRQATASDAPPLFKTSGPYGWVRHPIYSGWFLMVFAEPVMSWTRLMFAIVSGIYLVVAIPFEERSLRGTAGDAYERYKRIVRWKLIPGVY